MKSSFILQSSFYNKRSKSKVGARSSKSNSEAENEGAFSAVDDNEGRVGRLRDSEETFSSRSSRETRESRGSTAGWSTSLEFDAKASEESRPKRRQEDEYQREERKRYCWSECLNSLNSVSRREEHLRLMATLQQEWEEEIRLHQMNVRKQRSEMMHDIERIESEYDAKIAALNEKRAKVLLFASCSSVYYYTSLRKKIRCILIVIHLMRGSSLRSMFRI